jgi:hypothetical protein
MIVRPVPEIMDHNGGSRTTAKCFDDARYAKASVDQHKIDLRAVYSAPYRRVVSSCLLGRQPTDRPSPFRNWAQVGMMETKTATFDCAAHPAPGSPSGRSTRDRCRRNRPWRCCAATPTACFCRSRTRDTATVADQAAVQSGLAPGHCVLDARLPKQHTIPQLCTCPSEGANTTCDAIALSERD